MRAAVAQCDATELGMHAAAARVRLGELLGGDEGKTLREAGFAKMTAEDIVKPDRVLSLYAPAL
jgi:hypothetical protein